jgi:hypothetical protein
MSDLPSVRSATVLSVTTSGTGTAYVAFAYSPCTSMDIVNPASVDVEYLRNSTGTAMVIPAGGARLVLGLRNANEVSVRRVDTSATQVTVKAEAFL